VIFRVFKSTTILPPSIQLDFIMPRRPLAQISGNTTKGKELTPYSRGLIIGEYNCGVKPSQISRNLQIPRSTVIDTIQQKSKRDDGKSSPRPGRPKSYTERDKRHIIQLIKRDPFITYQAIRERTGLNVSSTTFLTILKESGYGHWRAKKRPKLTKEHAKLRLEWAKKHKDWTYTEWSKVIWSDESSIELGKGQQDSWVFHLNQLGEKWKKEYIKPYTKGKGLSIMIWAAIWGMGHSEITFLERDFESKKQGYSAKSYLEVLEANLFSIWEPGLEFMQDNAPIHSAHLIQQWFKDHGIPLMVWPPYSPDLNPIEHAWAKLKERIYKLDPELATIKGDNEELRIKFTRLIERAWEDLGQDYFDGLIRSMDSRVNAVLLAKGWYTKY
jgi:transposase